MMYARFFKRLFDLIISFVSLVVLLPVFMVLIIAGTIAMKGNPFFTQNRPGLNGIIFRLYKFRTMTNETDENGELLPDELRLKKYGKFLRKTSLDELPSLINIIAGDLAIVGPRPLLVKYLNRYNDEQKHRHDVRPGLTGYAQTHGRNKLSWEDKFAMDVWYTKNISFIGDFMIILHTIRTVLRHDGISSDTAATMEEFMGTPEGVEPRWKGPVCRKKKLKK